jgi:hypothetical protein
MVTAVILDIAEESVELEGEQLEKGSDASERASTTP